MADIAVHANNVRTVWEREVYREYMRGTRLARHMGMDENKVIQLKNRLKAERGTKISFPLVAKISGNAVVDDDMLEGNEVNLANYEDNITVHQYRKAVVRGNYEQRKTQIELLSEGRVALRNYLAELLRDTIIACMKTVNRDGVTTYASTTAAQADAWLDANTDRALYGASVSNLSTAAPAGGATYDHSGSLANVDSTNDTLTPSLISLAKRRAQATAPLIRPITVKEYGEFYVLFANKYAFRDLKNDSSYQQMLRDAEVRGRNNPLFTDGALYYDGVVIIEVLEFDSITGVGAGSIDVAWNAFCGAQAIGVAWGQQLKVNTKDFDYGNKSGVSVGETRGVKKLFFNNKQHGMLSLFTAGVADT